MASIGVTAAEVEEWRPWAAAYVDMEIEERPDAGTHTESLKNARDMARRPIDDDHSLALKRVNTGVPGHYKPTAGTRAARRAQPERAPSSAPATGPSPEAPPPPDQHDHEGDVELHYQDEDAAVSLGYHDDTLIDDDDVRMGPA